MKTSFLDVPRLRELSRRDAPTWREVHRILDAAGKLRGLPVEDVAALLCIDSPEMLRALLDAAKCSGSQFSLGDHRSLDEVIGTLTDQGFIPSFCTGCYRKGRVGQDFMELAKPGLIQQFCMPNGLFTFQEYLEDFASPAVRAKGKKLIERLVETADEDLRPKIAENLRLIESGERDVYL